MQEDTWQVVTTETLQAFADAWNRHDIDALMSFMTDDCVFQTAGGPDVLRRPPRGARGRAQGLRRRLAGNSRCAMARRRVTSSPATAACPNGPSPAPRADGTRVEADGVDIFTFRDGHIQVKNAFRKDRPPLPAR